MPNCFQLFRKDTKHAATLTSVDAELCQNLGLRWDEDRYTYGWYDYIGLRLAMGKSFAWITDALNERIFATEDTSMERHYRTMLRINHYLMEHYDSDCFYMVK